MQICAQVRLRARADVCSGTSAPEKKQRLESGDDIRVAVSPNKRFGVDYLVFVVIKTRNG